MDPVVVAKIQAAWRWITKHPRAIVAFFVSLLGAYLVWRFKRGNMSSFADAIEVRKETQSIAEKQGRATELYIQGNAKSEEAQKLEAEIAASKRRVVEIHQGESAQGKSDEEVSRIFTSSGF